MFGRGGFKPFAVLRARTSPTTTDLRLAERQNVVPTFTKKCLNILDSTSRTVELGLAVTSINLLWSADDLRVTLVRNRMS